MAVIHGQPGAEIQLLRECPPGLNSFTDIKPQLDTHKEKLEKNRTEFFKTLPELIKTTKQELDKLKEKRRKVEMQWDAKLDNISKSIDENRWMVWKYIELYYKKNFSKQKDIRLAESKIEHKKIVINELENDPESVFSKEQDGLITNINRLECIMRCPEYWGAYGELKVLEELKNLNDNYHVLCDVNVRLKDYVRYHGQRNLRSAQMDFVVVGPTGIYVIEVKNWSANEVNHHRGISPYEQVDRAGMVLWIYLKQHSFFYKPRVTNLLVPVQGNIGYNSSYRSVLIRNPNNLVKFINDNNNTLNDKRISKVVKILH